MAVLLMMSTAACADSPPSPSIQLTVSLPAGVPSRTVTCGTCTQPPFSWQTAEFSIDVADPSGRGGTVSSVEAVVRSVTRGVDLGSNRIPNASVGLPNASLNGSGTLTVPMGITFDIPPPRDDVQMTVTVTLTDGRRATATTRIGT